MELSYRQIKRKCGVRKGIDIWLYQDIYIFIYLLFFTAKHLPELLTISINVKDLETKC